MHWIKIFLAIFLGLCSLSTLLAQTSIHLHWDADSENLPELPLYRLELIQITKGDHQTVLDIEVQGTNYIFKTDLSGLFILRATPKSQSAGLKVIQKPLYWEGAKTLINPETKYLCASSLKWQWERVPGKSRYLVRVLERATSQVRWEKVITHSELELERSLFIPNSTYRVLVISYDPKGAVELAEDKVFTARSCEQKPIPSWGEEKTGSSRFNYFPEYQVRNYQSEAGLQKQTTGQAWLNFGAELDFPEKKEWSFGGAAHFSSYCSDLDFCQDQIMLRGQSQYKLQDQWRIILAGQYQNLSWLNMDAWEQDQRQVEDRVHLFSLMVGLKKRVMFSGYLWNFSSWLLYSPFSVISAGDSNLPNQGSLTHFGLGARASWYLHQNWQLVTECHFNYYQALQSITQYQLVFGPSYSF